MNPTSSSNLNPPSSYQLPQFPAISADSQLTQTNATQPPLIYILQQPLNFFGEQQNGWVPPYSSFNGVNPTPYPLQPGMYSLTPYAVMPLPQQMGNINLVTRTPPKDHCH